MSGSGTRNPNLGVVASQIGDASEPWRRNLGRTRMLLSLPRPSGWWTGLVPEECPGFDRASGSLHSLDMLDLNTCSRKQVLDYFNNTWTLNELLFSGLIGEEPFYRPPYHALRHPLIFYYVHPSVLYVSKLRLAGLIEGPVNTYFENIFETGVDEMSWDDMSKNEIEWPSIDDGQDYRRSVYKKVVQIIESHVDLDEGHPPILQSHPLWALIMSMEHERIHIETSSVLMRELPVHLVSHPVYWPAFAPMQGAEDKTLPDKTLYKTPGNNSLRADLPCMLDVPATTVHLGKSVDYPTYGWDNEYGERDVNVPAFAASDAIISNGQFWQFVASGGYRQKELWSDIGWRWRSFRNVKWPTFWVPDGPAGSHQFRLRTVFEIVPMQWQWPAVVNYHEAKAYCRWLSLQAPHESNYRLVSEAEHKALLEHDSLSSTGSGSGAESHLPARAYNTNLRLGSESDVQAVNRSGGQFGDLFGNVWQWAEDHFNALDGFKVHPLYDDFSTPCFDNEHQMIFGGSFVSTGDESTAFARFHFRPHFFQHAGFRVIRAASDSSVFLLDKKDVELAQVMGLHYGQNQVQNSAEKAIESLTELADFPARLSRLVVECCLRAGFASVETNLLEVGCAVGGTTFALAEKFASVVGLDNNPGFIAAARDRQAGEFAAPQFDLFDGICDGAILDRLPDSNVVLLSDPLERSINFGPLVTGLASGKYACRKNSLLILVAPQFLAPLAYSEAVEELTARRFELLEEQDLPLMLRENARQYKILISRVAVLRCK